MSEGDLAKAAGATDSETEESKNEQRDGERGVSFRFLLESVGMECVAFREKGREEVLYSRNRRVSQLLVTAVLL